MARVGVKWVSKGMLRFMKGAVGMDEAVREMMEESSFMRLRSKTMNREINEIRNKIGEVGLFGKKLKALEETYFYMIVKAQLIADTPIWLGAKEKALSGGLDLPTAIAQADQAVIDSQGSGHIKDLAGVQRGNPVKKLFTNFMSYFQTTWNLTVDSFTRTQFSNPLDLGRLGADLFLLYTAPILMTWFLREAFIKGKCDSGSDLVCVAKEIGVEHASYAMGGIIGLRELNSVFSGFFGYQGPAGTRFFAEAASLSKRAQKGELDIKLLRAALKTGGPLFHFPSGQLDKVLTGYMDIQDGKTGNILAPFFGRDRSND